MTKHKIRAVQLDLARQMETIVFIKQFVDFIAEHHFNTLVLYLEARIKTDSFPFPSEEDAYTKDEIREIVNYCTKKRIDVIPVVATLGHAELFLQYKEMEKLAELREGIKGRFSEFKNMFCPSLPETYQFLEEYLSDVASLFPSEFFHIGCDESWDIGFCSICKKAAGGENALFKQHILKVYDIVKNRLGKRVMMWDDLFEIYEDVLQDIPRDIVMCSWHYDLIDETPVGHFNNSLKEDPLALYDSLGFDSLFCSRANSIRNIETFTEYANSRKTLGGLATTWEKSTSFLYINFPTIAFAGHLWNGEENAENDLFNSVMKKIFHGCSDNYAAAYKTLHDIGLPNIHRNLIQYLPETLTHKEFIEHKLFRYLQRELENRPENLTDITSSICEDLHINLLIKELGLSLKNIVPQFYSPLFYENRLNLQKRLKKSIQFAKEIKLLRKKQWEKSRPNLPSLQLDRVWDSIINSLDKLLYREEVPDMLNIDFFLPEAYSAQSSKISILYTDGCIDTIVSGVLKPNDLSSTYFSRFFEIETNGKQPDSIIVESYGFGGIGFTYMNIKVKEKEYIPETITSTEGIVEHPARLLTNDQQWCYLGEKDTLLAVKRRSMSEQTHKIQIKLKAQ